MKKRTLFVLGLLFISSSLNISVSGEPINIYVNALNLEISQSEWEEKGEVSFESEGINVTLKDRFTKIEFIFREIMGRDVRLNFIVPPSYIDQSVLGLIETDDNVTVDWRVADNGTIISFELLAFQSVTFSVSKLDIATGGMKKSVHDFWSYVEYNGVGVKDQNVVVVDIQKEESGFEVDNKHITVYYKTDFFGWYYPIDDTSSKDIYYYMEDSGDNYRVVTSFKGNKSADIRVNAFPGASDGWFNKDAITGKLAQAWIGAVTSVKKTIIDIFGDKTPKYR